MGHKRDTSWGFAEFSRGKHFSYTSKFELAPIARQDLAQSYSRSELVRAMGESSSEECLYARTFGYDPEFDLANSDTVECVCLLKPNFVNTEFKWFRAKSKPNLLTDFQSLWRKPIGACVDFTNTYGPIIGRIEPLPLPVRLLRLESYLFDTFSLGLKCLQEHSGSQIFSHRIEATMEEHWSQYPEVQPDLSLALIDDWPMIRGTDSNHRAPTKLRFTDSEWKQALEQYLQTTLSCLFHPKYLLQQDGFRIESSHLLGSIYGQLLDESFATSAIKRCPICGEKMVGADGKPRRSDAQTCVDGRCRKALYRKRSKS